MQYVRGERSRRRARLAMPPSPTPSLAAAAEVGLGPADTVLALPSALYRGGATDLWLALAAGARIVLRAARGRRRRCSAGRADGGRARHLPARRPRLLAHVDRHRPASGTGAAGLSGGEPLSAALAGRSWSAAGCCGMATTAPRRAGTPRSGGWRRTGR